MQFGRDFPPPRDKQPSSRNSSSLSIKSPGTVSLKKAEDSKVRASSRSGHRNPLEKAIPKDHEAKSQQQMHIPAADLPTQPASPSDKPAESSGRQSSLKTEETQLPAPSKSDGKSEEAESYRQMMTPPLVIFGGQNAVRLDPLLTRKSSARSGRLS